MRSAEIGPKGGSSYVVVDGVEWSRHNSVAIAEAVRELIVADTVAKAEALMPRLELGAIEKLLN